MQQQAETQLAWTVKHRSRVKCANTEHVITITSEPNQEGSSLRNRPHSTLLSSVPRWCRTPPPCGVALTPVGGGAFSRFQNGLQADYLLRKRCRPFQSCSLEPCHPHRMATSEAHGFRPFPHQHTRQTHNAHSSSCTAFQRRSSGCA